MTLARRLALFVVPLTFFTASAAADPAAQTAAARFDKLKSLTGTWETSDPEGKVMGAVVYRVTSAGSAVEETLFGGTDHEMVTMYTKDGDDLVATHYCSLGNQPRMKAEVGNDATKISFAFTSGGNMKSRDEQHMDALVLTFKDDTHLHQDWSLYKAGKVVRVVAFDWAKRP